MADGQQEHRQIEIVPESVEHHRREPSDPLCGPSPPACTDPNCDANLGIPDEPRHYHLPYEGVSVSRVPVKPSRSRWRCGFCGGLRFPWHLLPPYGPKAHRRCTAAYWQGFRQGGLEAARAAFSEMMDALEADLAVFIHETECDECAPAIECEKRNALALRAARLRDKAMADDRSPDHRTRRVGNHRRGEGRGAR